MSSFVDALKMLFGRSQEQIDVQEKFKQALGNVDQRNEELDKILKDLEVINNRMAPRLSSEPPVAASIAPRKEALG